jgi:hypothetical protein
VSTRRAGYKGRTPIVVDEGPASAAVSDPVAALDSGGLPHLAVPHGGAGEIEISRIEVDEATRAAAREARTGLGQPMYVMKPSQAQRDQASRQRGAEATRARTAASKEPAPRTAASYRPPAKEEPAVEEAAHNVNTESPVEPPANAEFMAVAEAAREAAYADAALQAAEERHDAALIRLSDALAVVGLDFGRPDGDDPADQVMAIEVRSSESTTNIPETIPEPVVVAPTQAEPDVGMSDTNRHEPPATGGGPEGRDARVINAMRERGSVTAASIALGISGSRVRQLIEDARRRGTLPADVDAMIKRRKDA